ncbi:MAG: hypothetical protein IKB66_05570, partial [Clostridia bacterium]|nr:hypothetical protein [Clostridia bacterium]
MTDYNNLRLEEEAEISQNLIQSADKKLVVFKNALFEFVAILLLIALFLYENGELYVKEQGFLEFIGNIAVMYVLSTLFDNNYRIKGKFVGYSSEKYQTALKNFNQVSGELPESKMEELSLKLAELEEKLTHKARMQILLSVGITGKKYEELYKDKSVKALKEMGLTHFEIKAIKKARKTKAHCPTLYELLSEGEEQTKSQFSGKSIKRLDIEHNIRSGITYLLSAAVFAYFAVGLSKELTLASFGWFMLKACFLVFKGIASYFESFLDVSE